MSSKKKKIYTVTSASSPKTTIHKETQVEYEAYRVDAYFEDAVHCVDAQVEDEAHCMDAEVEDEAHCVNTQVEDEAHCVNAQAEDEAHCVDTSDAVTENKRHGNVTSGIQLKYWRESLDEPKLKCEHSICKGDSHDDYDHVAESESSGYTEVKSSDFFSVKSSDTSTIFKDPDKSPSVSIQGVTKRHSGMTDDEGHEMVNDSDSIAMYKGKDVSPIITKEGKLELKLLTNSNTRYYAQDELEDEAKNKGIVHGMFAASEPMDQGGKLKVSISENYDVEPPKGSNRSAFVGNVPTEVIDDQFSTAKPSTNMTDVCPLQEVESEVHSKCESELSFAVPQLLAW